MGIPPDKIELGKKRCVEKGFEVVVIKTKKEMRKIAKAEEITFDDLLTEIALASGHKLPTRKPPTGGKKPEKKGASNA
jgi:hypothetical protein